MRKILVTGSSGTIGTRLCERLLRVGYDVTGADRVPNQWNTKINALTVICDLCQEKELERLSSPFDLVIHLAANARIYNLVMNPILAFENMQSTFNVLEFCRRNSIPRLIFASSREVYGNVEGLTRKEDEACVSVCESPYTASKFSGEAMARAYEKCYGMDCVITRFSNVYGMYDLSDRIIPLYIRRAQRDEDLVVFGRDKVLDFTFIDDTVAGITGCIERFKDVAGKAVNIASGRGTRIIQVAEMIKEGLGSASRIVLRDNRTGEVVRFAADITQARNLLGYEPQVGIEEGIARSIAWYSHGQGQSNRVKASTEIKGGRSLRQPSTDACADIV